MSRISVTKIPLKQADWWKNNHKIKYWNVTIPSIISDYEGPHVLIVTDDVELEDLKTGRLLGSNSIKPLLNILDRIKTPFSRISVINYNCFNTRYLNKDDQAAALKHFNSRILKYIKSINPDTVMLCGRDCFENLIPSIPANQLCMEIGRIHIIDNIKYIPSISYSVISSTDVQKKKNYAGLIGEFKRHLETAIEGINKHNIDQPYKSVLIDSIKKYDKFYEKLLQSDTPCWDTEFTNLSYKCNKLLSIQCSLDGNTAYFIPYHHPETPFSVHELEHIRSTLQRYLENHTARFWIAHNAKAELGSFFAHLKARFIATPVWDTMNAEHALDENRKVLKDVLGASPYTLETLTHKYGSDVYTKGTITKANRGHEISSFNLQDLVDYGCKDVITCFRIAYCQLDQAHYQGIKNYERLVTEIVGAEVYNFFQLEYNGVPADKKYLMEMLGSNSTISQAIDSVKEEFRHSKAAQEANEILCKDVASNALFGLPWVFNIGKDVSKQTLFFDVLGLKPLQENTKGGKLDASFQAEYAHVPEVALLTKYNKNLKVKSTFIKKHLKRLTEDLDSQLTGCISSTYWLIGVLTGRASSVDPNLQQIPSRGPLAKPVKRQFVAKQGNIFIKVDFRSHEVNQWANISRDLDLVKMFVKGTKTRRKQRILDYESGCEKQFRKWVKNYDWKKSIKEKRVFAEKASGCLREYIHTLIDLELYGDSHKQSYSMFFNVPVDKVTPEQRQNVKAVIFGIIYGKGSLSLAYDLFKDVFESLDRKARNLLNMDDQEIEDWLFKKKKKYYKAAQDLMDKLFETFKLGGEWIKNSIKKANKTAQLVSPTGRVRHLWGYLHQDVSVQRSCDRQGPNSIVQGFSSELAFYGGRKLQECVWNVFHSKNKPFSLKQMNAVHDSSEDTCLFTDLPESLYYIEHAMTTMVHQGFKRDFDFEFLSQLEIEFEIGFSMDHMTKWDYTDHGLEEIITEQLEYAEKNLGIHISDSEIDKMWKSWDTVKCRRLAELKAIKTDVEYTPVHGVKYRK